jgi:hypothetical protein
MGNLRGFRISYAGKGCRRKIVCREKATPIVNWIKLKFQPGELSRIHFLGTDGTPEAVPFPISPRAAVYEVTAGCETLSIGKNYTITSKLLTGLEIYFPAT